MPLPTSKSILISFLAAAAVLPACDENTGPRPPSAGLIYVAYRNLDGGQDGILLVDAAPDSAAFGSIQQRVDMGEGVLPHHLYFNRDKSRLYVTALGGARLYEIILAEESQEIVEIVPIDVGDNVVAEDIYFLEDGSRYYVTFMGGQGGAMDGSVGVFDADTNNLIKTISAPVSAEDPFILWPHGISANEDAGVMMVTSTVAPDNSGAGNTVTTIDLDTDEVVATYLVAPAADQFTVPAEVIMLRDGLDPYVLVTTIGTGDIWVAPYDEDTGAIDGEFSQEIVGADEGLGAGLEFYVRENNAGDKELYVSFGAPGVVNVYRLDRLPQLPLKRTLEAEPGSHHVVFFPYRGRDLAVIQNNLLNLDGLNTGTLTVREAISGDLRGEIDLPAEEGLMVESIESAYGTGYLLHH